MGKRRTKGDGGLYQRHDHPDCPPVDTVGTDEHGRKITVRPKHACKGRWVGTLDAAAPDGTTKRKYVYGRTQKEAKAKLDKALGEKATGTLVLVSMTTEAWLLYWIDEVADLKPQTRKTYRGYIANHIVPALGRHALSTLRPEHIRSLHKRMRQAGKSETSVRQAHAILRKALTDALHDGKIVSNPALRVKTPSVEKNPRDALDTDQAWAVLRSTDDARWWLALFYGMRQGECLGLDWAHVDLDEGVLYVRQTLQVEAGGVLSFGTPKSKTSRRDIPIVPLVEARLRLAWELAGRPKEGLVFHDGTGAPRKPWADHAEWKALLAEVGVPEVALHAARNSAAALMEAAGLPDRLVAQILGHAQVQITHGYQRAQEAQLRSALSRLDEFVRKGIESVPPATPSPALPPTPPSA